MTVYFIDKKLLKACTSEKEAQKRFGAQNGGKILQRLSEMRAAESLADLFKLPAARCHLLKGDRKGRFAVDAKHPYRIVFEPCCSPVPMKPDGGMDTEKICEVCILAVEDYHD
jgi:plasmid maintenance system killer protein